MSMINGTRLYDHLTRLGQIGFVPKEGTTRLPYTPAYDEGRIYVQQCMEQAGLQTSVDPVGNLIGTLPGQGEIICIGSHIDTVPGGGIYDGTYGVLSGIECVQRLKELGYQNRHPIQVIAFTEEEGNVIGGTFGSKAFTGGEIDEAMRPNLALHGLTMEQVGACRRDLTQYQCYLELHIEQGKVLEECKTQVGIVGTIAGPVRYRVYLRGMAEHSGATPMDMRSDALCAAAARALRWGGRFFLVHKPERLVDLMTGLRAARLEPKRIRFVRHRAENAVNLVLIESRLGGRPGLQYVPDLFLYEQTGELSAEGRRIYHLQE